MNDRDVQDLIDAGRGHLIAYGAREDCPRVRVTPNGRPRPRGHLRAPRHTEHSRNLRPDGRKK